MKREECDLMKNSVIFLGPIIKSKGIRPTENGIEAITQLHPFVWPDAPWYRVHIDHTEIRDNIVITDKQSKHIDAHFLPPTNSYTTIEKLHLHMGFQIVLFLITLFTGRELKQLCTYNDIKSIHSFSFHPLNNVLSGKAVQTINTIRTEKNEGDLEDNLYNTPFYDGRNT